MTDVQPPLTVSRWRKAGGATPPCPNCGRCLGIRFGKWRENGRDAWLCDECGEFEVI